MRGSCLCAVTSQISPSIKMSVFPLTFFALKSGIWMNKRKTKDKWEQIK